VLGAIAFGNACLDELPAARGQFGQALLLLGGCWCGGGLHRLGESRKHSSVDGIGFGALPLGAGEVAYPACFQDGNQDVGGMENAHDRLFVAASGFTDDMNLGMGTEEFKEFGMTLGIIGEEEETALKMKLQRGLGNIEADVEDDGVVLTHTCDNASRVCVEQTRSSNGSSLDQRADVERAPRRITLQAYARRKRSRVGHRPAPCRGRGDPSLASSLKETKWTILYIQDAEARRGKISIPATNIPLTLPLRASAVKIGSPL